MHALAALLAAILVGLAGCGPNAVPAQPVFPLQHMPANAACELVREGWLRIKFHIAAGEFVTAELDDELVVPTAWDQGFVADPRGGLLVRDRAGNVVVRDGQVVAIPDRGFPTLVGHLVCVSSTVVWVFDEGPP